MRIRRIVLDSNVVISAFLFGGVPARVLGMVLDRYVQCFICLSILDEVRDVLQRPKFGISSEQALSLVEELRDLCEVISPKTRVEVLHDDPDDNMVLECALAADAEIIVSGDGHLLDLEVWRGIRILSPADFVREMHANQ